MRQRDSSSGNGEDALAARLRPVSRQETLGDQAYQSLRTALRRGMLAPGERLTTRELAQTLGISLTPAREALNRLIAERLLEQGPGRTAIVPILTRSRYEELCLIRLELEGLAAREGCAHLGAADLERLEVLYAAHEAAYHQRNTKEALRHNEDFHFTIYGAARMPTLLQMLETLWLQVGPSMNLLLPVSYQHGWPGGEHHRAMLAAIRGKDAEALVRAVRGDLEDGRKWLATLLPERT